MISFLEMVQHYPIGAKVNVPEKNGEKSRTKEIAGYEYYNGTGYLLFRDKDKLDVEQVAGIQGMPSAYKTCTAGFMGMQ